MVRLPFAILIRNDLRSWFRFFFFFWANQKGMYFPRVIVFVRMGRRRRRGSKFEQKQPKQSTKRHSFLSRKKKKTDSKRYLKHLLSHNWISTVFKRGKLDYQFSLQDAISPRRNQSKDNGSLCNLRTKSTFLKWIIFGSLRFHSLTHNTFPLRRQRTSN